MTRDKFETIVAGVGTLIFGIFLIILGIVVHDKLWFTVLMTITGTIFSVYALQYLTKKRH